MRLGADEIARAMGARVLGEAGKLEFTSFAIDSRRVQPGALFFALRGPTNDGHDFIPSAIAAGARGIVVSRADYAQAGSASSESASAAHGSAAAAREDRSREEAAERSRQALRASLNGRLPYDRASQVPPEPVKPGLARRGSGDDSLSGAPAAVVRFVVDDTTLALQSLATAVRGRLSLVVGITGSAGKTTAKEMTAAVLASRRPTGKSAGNLNNLYGLPLTLLNMDEGATAAVLEMGMSYPGEIARLVEIADPDIGVILNVREVHLGNFSSIEDIATAKGELFRGMRKNATAVWNAADARVRRLAEGFPGPKVSFGIDASADLIARNIEDDIVRGVSFRLQRHGGDRDVRLSTFGRHNVDNALAALAVASSLGNDLDGAVRAVSSVRAASMRGEVLRLGEGIVLVDDTYNSNPSAMASVLSSLAVTAWPGRKVVVAGDMLELGPRAAEFHRQVGEQAARAGIGLLVAVGPLSAETGAGAEKMGLASVIRHADSRTAAESVASILAPGDLVVVKGSRGIAMETFVTAARAAFGEGARP